MSKSVLAQPIEVFFAAAQKGLLPARLMGGMGTPHAPRYYSEGDSVPWWIECRWPIGMPVVFACDVETFWLDGNQHVYPLWSSVGYVIEVNAAGTDYSLIWGAPTFVHTEPRPKRPHFQPARLALEGGMG